MGALSRLADKRPFVFALLAILAWFSLGAMIVAAAMIFAGVSLSDDLPQSVAALGATFILLIIAQRLGWLGPIGYTRLGTPTGWLLTLFLLTYILLAGLFAFFGELGFDAGALIRSEVGRTILLRQTVVGFVEETLFRGIVFYALLRVWGRTTRGVLTAVSVQAICFAVIHMLQLVSGNPVTVIVANIVETTAFGLLMGLLVLLVDTLWPAVVIHAASNASILFNGLTTPWVEPPALGYLRLALFELMLVAVGVWLLVQRPHGRLAVDLQRPEDLPER